MGFAAVVTKVQPVVAAPLAADQQILDYLTKDTGQPPTWADTYNKWFATEYLPWINSVQGTNVKVSDLSVSKEGTIIPNSSIPLWDWNTGADTAAQKATLDRRYVDALDAYNQKNGTSLQPNAAVLGTNVQPNSSYRAPDKGGFLDTLKSVAVPVGIALATGGAGAALGASLGIGTAAGTALAGAGLGALQGQDLGQITTNAAIGGVAGSIGSGIGSEVGNATVGQLAGGTTSGLLRGQDLGTALTGAAINTGANQAAGGLLSAINTPSSEVTSTGLNDYTSGANYDLTSGQNTGGLGLTATPAPLDMSNPYSFDTTTANTGGLGVSLADIGYNTLTNTETGNPLGQELAGITTGAEDYLSPEKPVGTSTSNPAAQKLLSNLLKSALIGNTGTGNNMATTNPQDNSNAALSSLLGGLLGGAGNLMQGSTNVEARQKMADELRAAGQQAAAASQFRPIGTTTRFGTSNYQVNPTTGQLESAGYTLSPEAQAYQNALGGMTNQGLMQGQQMQGLANQYLGESPEAVRQRYIQQQTALLAPQQEQQLAGIRNNLFQTGRQGLATGATTAGGLAATNPEMAAYYNSLANQQRQIAAGADQAAQQQVQFGQGLAANAFNPFTTGFGAQSAVEKAAQQPMGLSTDLAAQFQKANQAGGAYNLEANKAASQTMFPANQYNPAASLLSGASGSSQLTGALGGLLGSTSAGSALGSWLSGLGGASDTWTGSLNGLDTSNIDYEYLKQIYAGGDPFANQLAPGETWNGE